MDCDEGVVRLEPGTTKNDEGRTFPFDVLPQLEALLREQRERVSSLEREQGRIIPWVFTRNGKPVWSCRTAWANAVGRAAHEEVKGKKVVVRPQLVGSRVHDLRRTAVRNLVRAGVPDTIAMALTGHKTRHVFDRYNIINERDLREGVSKLAVRLQQQASK